VSGTVLSVQILHDALIQKGGAERVVSLIANSFHQVPIYTFAYEPNTTFESFRKFDVFTPRIECWKKENKLNLALYILTYAKRWTIPDANLTFISTSGWAHLLNLNSPSITYVHSPAKWLYETPDYFYNSNFKAKLFQSLSFNLRRMDRQCMGKKQVVIANSANVARKIQKIYGSPVPFVLPPISSNLDSEPFDFQLPERFVLMVARSQGYKNYAFALELASEMPDVYFIFVSSAESKNIANVLFLSNISDQQLNFLYSNASVLLCVAKEDLGLTPLEALKFGTPTVALAKGGYLETIQDQVSGFLIPDLSVSKFRSALNHVIHNNPFESELLKSQAKQFGVKNFLEKIEELSGLKVD